MTEGSQVKLGEVDAPCRRRWPCQPNTPVRDRLRIGELLCAGEDLIVTNCSQFGSVKVISSSPLAHKPRSLRPSDGGTVYTAARWAPDSRLEAAGVHQNMPGPH